ncbi:MAG: Flp family type IVb pilin [Alphaproteobacteria bacterium]|nr:Flp family type IVb pilin [Alphaproteobacteria bacterium]
MADAAGGLAAHSDAARSFVGDRSGATAIEYAMIASLISIMIVAGATTIGTQVKTFFEQMIVPFL